MTTPQLDAAHHADNQRRLSALETKIDCLAADTADLLEMWKDAGVFFKWMRRLGTVIVWMAKVAAACGALWALWRYGGNK